MTTTDKVFFRINRLMTPKVCYGILTVEGVAMVAILTWRALS